MKQLLTLLLLLVLLPLITYQQTCKSHFIDENETTTSASVTCPITFINDENGCKAFKTVYDKIINNINCNQDSDCKFRYMKCISNKCYQADRIEGDSCTHHEQCVTTKDSIKKGGLYCKDNKCKLYKMKFTKKIGEKCGDVDHVEGLYYSCEFGSSCILGSCLKTPMVGKDENCTRVFNPFKEFRVCQASFYCGEDSVCVNSVRLGVKCEESISCQSGYSCRKSMGSSDAICQRYADFDEYCNEDIDCGNTNSGIVKCLDNKCKRLLSGLKGSSCTNHNECYSGFCDKTSNKCQGTTLDNDQTCYNSTWCSTGLSGGCVCGGKEVSSNIMGKCLPSCVGPLNDVISCLYNRGLDIGSGLATSLTPGLGYAQYVERDSGIYRYCRRYYERYYTCLYHSWKNIGQSSTINEINGFRISTTDLSTTFENVDIVLPRRSNAHGLLSTPYNLLVLIVMVVIVDILLF